MDFENIITLIKTVSDSNVTGFKYEKDGMKLNIQKEAVQTVVAHVEEGTTQTVIAENTSAATVVQTEEVEGSLIKSPLVGRFYVAPAEDAAPFVKVGDTIKKGQVVAIVEAMKLMNDIESEFDGTVAEVLAENGETVEFGQPLFRIV